jgi:membrane-bound serine protease (ClpP class)
MNLFFRPFLVALSILGFSHSFSNARDGDAPAAKTSVSWKDHPVVIRVESSDLTDGRRVREIVRMVEQADQEKAGAIILELDVSGDVPVDSLERVLDAFAESETRTVTFVNSSATGLGALLALVGDAIYIRASGIIGGAGVVIEGDTEDDKKNQAAKRNAAQSLSVLRARARSLAKIKGHREAVVEAMVDESEEVKIGEQVFSPKGEVLTLTADEAVQEIEGKRVLAKGIVKSIEEILKSEKLKGKVLKLTPREFGEGNNRERLSLGTKAGKKTVGEEEEEESLFGKREGSFEGKAVVIEVGMDTLATGKASFDFIDRTVKKAELDGAAAVVFDMHTPGGIAWYTDSLVLDTLQNLSIPTITFVNPKAESAGAILAVGTDHIYMRPAATIGSALVISGTGQDLNASLEDKITQMIIGTVRNVAELKGHNPDVAEAFVTREKEVKIDGVVIHEAGNVLNLNTIRATEEIGGRPVLAKGVANSIEEILEKENIEAEVLKAEPLGMEAFAHWVQKLSILLIVVGLAGAYMELNSPGFGLPGLLSVLAFSIFFFGNYLAGNLAGYELAVLLVLGLVLIGLEVFVFPGAIIPGAIGGALVLVALGLAMVDRVDLEWKWEGLPGAESWLSIFRGSFITVSIGLVGALVAVFAGMRFLPETKLGSRFILQEAINDGAAMDASEKVGSKIDLVGSQGETTTDLVPSGKAMIDGNLLDVVSEGQFIKKGEAIVVTAHEASRIVVDTLA